MVNALASADMMLTNLATRVTSGAAMANIRAIIMKSGAPGGCPTRSLSAVEINSPQSQKLADASVVKMYVTAEIKKASQPITLSISL